MAWTDFISGITPIRRFLSPEKGYEDAGKRMRQSWMQAQGYTKPYMQAGASQIPRLTSAEDQLFDPAALESKWASSYEESPYAKELLEENKNQGLDAASSMGLMGSSAALGNIQQGAGNIVRQDRERYMTDLMNKFLQAIGIGQNIYGTGSNTASEMARERMGLGQNQAGLAYGKYAAPNELFEKMLGAGVRAGVGGATGGAGAVGGF